MNSASNVAEQPVHLGFAIPFVFDQIYDRIIDGGLDTSSKLPLSRVGRRYFVSNDSFSLLKEVIITPINDLPAYARRRVWELRKGLIQISTVFECVQFVPHDTAYLGPREIWVPLEQ